LPTIPEIVDNRQVLLKDVINTLIKNTSHARFAAGYFYLSGFEIIRENVKPDSKIDIVIGVETDEITATTIQEGYDQRQQKIKNRIILKMTESIEYISEDAKEGINTLIQLIRKGNIDVKIYTKEKFHSKAYIFDVEYDNGAIKDSYAIVGSSNFTRRGLGTGSGGGSNTELNAVLRQPSAVKEVKKWFDNIWDESEDFNIELLNIIDNNFKFKKLEYTPFDIILKSLYELYKNDEIYKNLDKLNLDELAEFQQIAVYRAISILNKYNGVIIADSVGLGKTYVAKGLLQYFDGLGKNVLIICPASLRSMWQNETKGIEVKVSIISQESIGMHGLSNELTSKVDAIIIDEAHNFRNENASRFRELVRHTMGKKVVQLTATPINNSIFDLYNIMTLFIKEDEFKDKLGIASVREVFKNYPAEKDYVDNILSEIMIKRSRNFIKKKYGKNNELIVKGRKLKFPKRHIKTINYSIADVYGEDIYDSIADRLERLYLPVISEEKLTAQQEALIIGLVRKTFLKRLESSVEAFRKSIKKQMKYCELLLDSIGKGYLICKKYAMENIIQDADIDLNKTISIEEYEGDINELINNVQSDYDDFKYMFDIVSKINVNKDVKLQALINKLNGELRNKKVIIFTEYTDTARYIYESIKYKVEGVIEQLDGEKKKSKERIVKRFAPKANNYDVKDGEGIDILITTDVLSEGQNLQDCNILINYDLSWNPVRIIQREGRIDRVTTEFDDIYIYNFMPEDKLEDLLNLVDRINNKIKYITETIGSESKILSEDEIIKDKVFNDEDTDSLRELSRAENKSAFISKLEEQKDDMVPTEEYMREDYKNLVFTNSLNKQRAEKLPDGIYSIKKSDKHKGVYMYYKVGDKNFWLFYDYLSNRFITNKAKIYKIISEGSYLDIKPLKRKVDMDVDQILQKGKEFVNSRVQNIIQSQMAVTRISKVQKDIAERVEKMFFKAKYRSRITKEQRKIRQKLKKPLHRGTLMKLKELKIEKMSDDELLKSLDKILSYIELDEMDNNNNLRDRDIELICYEILV